MRAKGTEGLLLAGSAMATVAANAAPSLDLDCTPQSQTSNVSSVAIADTAAPITIFYAAAAGNRYDRSHANL